MVESVQAHQGAMDLLSEGIPEGVVRGEYCGIPCQARLDWFDPHRCIADLKTCDDITYFEADARRFGYAYQMSFYQALLQTIIGLPMPVFFIAVEKRPPFRCGVWQAHQDVLDQARRENEAAIERLKLCRQRDVWPTHYEETRWFLNM
jgi:hypothetical protein